MPLNKNPNVATSTAVATPPKSDAAPVVEAIVETVIDAVAKDIAATVPSLQPSDMKPEQKRIQRSGVWQATVQSNALVQYAPTLDAYLDLVVKVADRGLEYVNRT